MTRINKQEQTGFAVLGIILGLFGIFISNYFFMNYLGLLISLLGFVASLLALMVVNINNRKFYSTVAIFVTLIAIINSFKMNGIF